MTDRLISICICTYRRPSVADTIASLGEQRVPENCRLEIIVADNDIAPSSRDTVESAGQKIPFPVRYVHAPKQNISIARNACLTAADGDYVAFIDDDEVATREWLLALYIDANKRNLDIAFGPVRARYPDDAPAWLVEADFHSTRADKASDLNTGYSGNSFFRVTHPAIKNRRFNLERGRTGGEDTQFFHECYLAGARLGYVDAAEASEPVPQERLSMEWLVTTRYRSGITYGKVVKYRGSLANTAAQCAISFAKCLVLLTKSAVPFRSKSGKRTDYIRAMFHLGCVNAAFAAREQEMYGTDRAATSSIEP
ncbi:MAG: glycosyltransferase family 2 protein [Pseudomonadota bacterium]|nr:glycosyltransferase family 2 protein [Pseudomonadota bacterium]